MQANPIDNRKDASFAVVRSYHPTRIERELLARVFELACHPTTSQRDATHGDHWSHDRASQVDAQHATVLRSADSSDAQLGEPERAA